MGNERGTRRKPYFVSARRHTEFRQGRNASPSPSLFVGPPYIFVGDVETRGGEGEEEGYRFARVLRVKTRYRIGSRRFPTPFSPHFPYTTPPPPTFNPARVSATRVVEEFFEASRLGSAKWIRLPPSGVASSGLPKRHSPLLTFRFAFSSPLFLSLPPRFSPLHLGVQQRYTMAAVIRCNGGE